MRDLRQKVQQFAAQLKREFAEQHGQNAPSFRKQVVSTLSASLSPGPGRPPLPNITLAAEEREKGTPWKIIYPMCIPNYNALNRDSQRVEAENLRAAVRSRRNARRRRNPTQEFSTN
jgi:hypothetical protein